VPTRGTETSQYPEEEKAKATPSVAASERGPAQTHPACRAGVVGPALRTLVPSRTVQERRATEGDSPVGEGEGGRAGT
jgi:hypothetical protein